MDFPTWLANTNLQLGEIHERLVELERELSGLRRATDATKGVSMTLAAEMTRCEGRSGPFEEWSQKANSIQFSLSEFHDVEVVVTRNFLLSSAGLNLDSLFPAVAPSEGVAVRQDGSAVMEHLSTNPENLSVAGRNSLSVPLAIETPGFKMASSVHMDISVYAEPSSRSVRALVARNPSVAQKTLNRALGARIEEAALVEAARGFNSIAVNLPQIDLIPSAFFRSAWLDNALRCVGGSGRQSRVRRPGLPAVQSGYGIGVKMLQESIWSIVRTEVAASGAQIFSGPAVSGAKSFAVTAGLQDSGSIKVGCDVVRWEWRVALDLSFQVSIVNSNVLQIVGGQVGSPHVHFKVRPHLGWLTDQIERIVEDVIRDNIPQMQSIRKRFILNGVRSCDANFWREFIVFSLNT